MNRREFIKSSGCTIAALSMPSLCFAEEKKFPEENLITKEVDLSLVNQWIEKLSFPRNVFWCDHIERPSWAGFGISPIYETGEETYYYQSGKAIKAEGDEVRIPVERMFCSVVEGDEYQIGRCLAKMESHSFFNLLDYVAPAALVHSDCFFLRPECIAGACRFIEKHDISVGKIIISGKDANYFIKNKNSKHFKKILTLSNNEESEIIRLGKLWVYDLLVSNLLPSGTAYILGERKHLGIISVGQFAERKKTLVEIKSGLALMNRHACVKIKRY